MRLNRSMNATGGRTVPHVDGVAIPAFAGRVAGSPVGCWFRGRPLVQLQFGPNDWRLCVASADGQSFEQVSPAGQNHLFGGDQVWAADLDGYRDSRGYVNPNWVPVAIDDLTSRVAVAVKDTGALAVWDGFVLLPVEPTGPDLWSEDDLSFIGGLLAYRKNGVIKVWPEPLTVARIPAAGVCVANGYALEYQDGRGVVLRALGSTQGFVVSESGRDFGRDMRARPDGTLVVVSSSGPEERPEEFQRYEVNPVLRTVNGEPRPLVDLATLPDEPPAPVPTFAPMPCRVTVFDEPGVEFPFVFCTVGRDSLTVAADEARRLNLPIAAYVDDVSYPPSWVPNVPGVEVIPTIQAYPSREPGGEMRPLADVVKAIAATVLTMRAAFPRVAVVLAAYRQIKTLDPPTYNWPIPYVLELQAAVWDLCRQAGVTDVLLFVWTRGESKDGIVSRPEFREALARMRAAASRLPTPPPTPVPTPASVSDEDSMIARLPKSRLTPSRTFPGRWLYRLSTGRYLSVDGATGSFRPGGTATDGDSEAFEWDGKSDHCDIAPGNADGLRFFFRVDLAR